MALASLWKCKKCERLFANRNQSHSCFRYTLREHLAGNSPFAITLFRGFAKLVKRCGSVRIVPEKTRIAFQARMSFAAVSLRRDRIVGHLVLARRLEHPRFTKIESISPHNHVHSFRLIRIQTWITKFSRGFAKPTASDANFTYRSERATGRID